MSKAKLMFNGDEYIFESEYLFSSDDDNNRWIKAELREYRNGKNELFKFRAYSEEYGNCYYKYIKLVPTELDELKDSLKKLINNNTDQLENFKKKVRHLVNKDSTVIPHTSIIGYEKFQRCISLKTKDMSINLPDDN